MKSRSFVLQACAVGVVTAALLLTACGGLGSGYSYPYYPPYQPSHSSGSASDSSGSSSSTPESSSSESSSEEPSSPASSEPPAPSEPELTPEQRLALYRSEVLQLLNTGRTVPFSAPASALSDAAQTRAEELPADGQALPQAPQWQRLHFSPAREQSSRLCFQGIIRIRPGHPCRVRFTLEDPPQRC